MALTFLMDRNILLFQKSFFSEKQLFKQNEVEIVLNRHNCCCLSFKRNNSTTFMEVFYSKLKKIALHFHFMFLSFFLSFFLIHHLLDHDVHLKKVNLNTNLMTRQKIDSKTIIFLERKKIISRIIKISCISSLNLIIRIPIQGLTYWGRRMDFVFSFKKSFLLVQSRSSTYIKSIKVICFKKS